MVVLVVFELDASSASRLVDGFLHAVGDGVGIHDHLAVDITGGTTGSLCQRAVRTQEPFLVGIEDGNERDFRQVETFTQQVHADQHVVDTGAQVVHDLHAVECGHVAMDIVGLDTVIEQIFRQFLGHALGQRGNQHTLVAMAARKDLVEQIVDLIL